MLYTFSVKTFNNLITCLLKTKSFTIYELNIFKLPELLSFDHTVNIYLQKFHHLLVESDVFRHFVISHFLLIKDKLFPRTIISVDYFSSAQRRFELLPINSRCYKSRNLEAILAFIYFF